MLPPTFASKPTSVPVVPLLFTLKIASAVSTVVELTVVCVPCTVKLPVIVASPAILTADAVISSDKNEPLTVKLLLTVTSFGKPIVTVSVALTATSTSFAVPENVNVSPPSIVCVLDPSLTVNEVLIEAVDAAVIRPCWSTVITGIAVELPYDAAVTAVSSKSI